MNWNEFAKDYLAFTRKERIGVLAIIVFVLLVAFVPKMIPFPQQSSSSDTTWISTLKQLEKKDTEMIKSGADEDNYSASYTYQYEPSETDNTNKSTQLFYFDPNTISFNGWKKLGLKERIAKTILNYRAKGGYFRKPEDLKKIYGLQESEFERLSPYVKIKSQNSTAKETSFDLAKPQNGDAEKKNYTYSVPLVDINTADTLMFIALPGIGSKLASRIINFRDKLGGFYSIDQVGETYALPDSTFRKIKQYLELKTLSLRKININTASIDVLKAHPYIKWSVANPIVAYRNEHGAFSSIEDIKKIATVSDELFDKIAPYLTAK